MVYIKAFQNPLFSVFPEGEQTLKFEHIEELLQQGANINEVNGEFKRNFLQKMIEEEFAFEDAEKNELEEEILKILQLLFDYGIDINHQDSYGNTALHCAILEGEFLLAKWLLDHGANRAIVDSDGNTAWHYLNQHNPQFQAEEYAKDRKEMLTLLRP